MAKVKLTDENVAAIEAFMDMAKDMFVKTTGTQLGADHQTNFEFRKTIVQDGKTVTFHCAAYIDPTEGVELVKAPAKEDIGPSAGGDESDADRKKALIDEIKEIDPSAKASARMNVSTLEKMLEEVRQANAEEEDPFGLGEGQPAPAVTYDDLKEKLMDVMDAKGKDTIRAMLDSYGAKSLKDVPEDKYPDLMKAANKLLDD